LRAETALPPGIAARQVEPLEAGVAGCVDRDASNPLTNRPTPATHVTCQNAAVTPTTARPCPTAFAITTRLLADDIDDHPWVHVQTN
jgi:hypothetical protein